MIAEVAALQAPKPGEQAMVITVRGNEGKELAPGTLNVILKEAGLK